ncbi:MAG: hypothetical protein Q7J56_03525 [Deltaproteobacteria bacterium]|nr:hypothetical protein [Deltaproteobacteria bacterium]
MTTNAELLEEARRLLTYTTFQDAQTIESNARTLLPQLADALAASNDEVFVQTEARNELRDALKVARARLVKARERNRALVEALRVIRDAAAASDECGAESIDDRHAADCFVGIARAALGEDAKAGDYVSPCPATKYGHCDAYREPGGKCCYCGETPESRIHEPRK